MNVGRRYCSIGLIILLLVERRKMLEPEPFQMDKVSVYLNFLLDNIPFMEVNRAVKDHKRLHHEFV